VAFKTFTNGSVLTDADLNDYLMKQAVISCTSGTRPSSPPEGMLVYETDTDVISVYKGAAWKRYAVDVETNTALQDEDSTTISGVTSTSFIPGSPVVQVTFVAPPSGKVVITVTGSVSESSNGNKGQLGWELRAGVVVGSGTLITATSNNRCVATSKAVVASGPAEITASNRYMKTSLTPGDSYHVFTAHRTTPAGTMTVDYRHLLVEPVL
jgi:hypothetical protein